MAKRKNRNVIALPVHPKYAKVIISGEKKVEFRRNGMPKDVTHIVIYSTRPDQKIIGFCQVRECIVAPPESLWKKFKEYGSITRKEFFAYYEGYPLGCCYILDNPQEFRRPIPLSESKLFSHHPQSFVYLEQAEWKNLKRKKVVRL